MVAKVLDGAGLAARIRGRLRLEAMELREQGVMPGLGTILVGDDGPSAAYVRLKHQDCAEIGIASIGEHLPADVSQEDLANVIGRFNDHAEIDAYILQLPLPRHLDEEQALLAIDPLKDADGLHPVNLGKLVMGKDGPLPCTPHGIQQLLADGGVDIDGKHVVVVGRGLTIGRPLALLLALKRPAANAAVSVVHTGVPNLSHYTRQADIVVAAAGAPGLITADMIRPGAAVVGAGVTMEGKRVVSDVVEDVAEVAGWVTPRLGGVGPMTRAMLLVNTIEAAKRRAETKVR